MSKAIFTTFVVTLIAMVLGTAVISGLVERHRADAIATDSYGGLVAVHTNGDTPNYRLYTVYTREGYVFAGDMPEDAGIVRACKRAKRVVNGPSALVPVNALVSVEKVTPIDYKHAKAVALELHAKINR